MNFSPKTTTKIKPLTITEFRAQCKEAVAKINEDHKATTGKDNIKARMELARKAFAQNMDRDDASHNTFMWSYRDLGYDNNYYGDREDMEFKLNEKANRHIAEFRKVVGTALVVKCETSHEYGDITITMEEAIKDKKTMLRNSFIGMVGDSANVHMRSFQWGISRLVAGQTLDSTTYTEDEAKRVESLGKIFGLSFTINAVPTMIPVGWTSRDTKAGHKVSLVMK